MLVYKMHVQSVRCSKSLVWLVMCIFLPRSHSLTLENKSLERTGLHKGFFVVPEYFNNILGTNSHI